MCPQQQGKTLEQILREFGGGIELTTLVGIPKGSGLGTSSILGAVIMAVLHRMLGRPLTDRELFHQVLRLEQALTTGGGWQDQVGGAMPSTKITYTQPGLFPDPRVHYVPSDILNPRDNGGTTLLYYTGLTRLAKNILQQVVGGFLNRDRELMAALRGVHQVAQQTVDAMARKNAAEFGHLTNVHWRLTKILCPDISNPQVDQLLERIRPHVHGARLIGAGSGGFMLMICKSPEDAARVRADLEANPLNDCSRFFDFEVNNEGLKVTAC
jgi:galactokinase/mevalonate kinase-like predicted kinase